MRSVKERYMTDAVFHAAVDSMRALLQGAQLTPSEVREAAMLACIIEEERRPVAPLSCSEEELERMREHFIKPAAERMADDNDAWKRRMFER